MPKTKENLVPVGDWLMNAMNRHTAKVVALEKAVFKALGYEDGYIPLHWREQRVYSHWDRAMLALNRATDGVPVRISYDVNYGIDRRTGWSVSINGVVYSQFEHEGPIAICKAIVAFKGLEIDSDA